MKMLGCHGFDMWAEGYDRAVDVSDDNNEYPFAGYKKLMNAVYAAVMQKSPAKVLDIGIGTGTLASKLYDAGNDITGVDFSNKMLSEARIKMPDAKLIPFDFTKGLPAELKKKEFDFIISTYALHHLQDEAKIKFIRSLLKHIGKTGSIIVGDVGFRTRSDLEKCKKTCGSNWDDDEYYFVFSELEGRLGDISTLSYHPFSHCAGIIEIHS